MKKNHPPHPPSLRIFFATELWERYGFYVIQTLLALYLTLHFKWPDKEVYALVGSFTALTYISPVIGGWIADHLLGQKRSILTGAVVLLASYIAVALAINDHYLTQALAGIAVGTGLLKPNISSLLGNEYSANAPHRESGFTIFYMGITCGIILGTTLPSYLNEHLGWSISFISAAIGMCIAIAIFSFGIYYYRIKDYVPYRFRLKKIILAMLVMSGLWLLSFYILHYPSIADSVFIIIVLLSLLYLLGCIKSETAFQARQTMAILLLCTISVMFWAFYFQMFLSLTLFIARCVKPTLAGMPFPPPYYVGIQSLGLIIFGLFLSHYQNTTPVHRAIRTGNKFVLAMFCITGAYVSVTLVCYLHLNHPALLSPFSIIPAYLMIALAELFLSPVGLSAITQLASRKKVSTMMGIFFVSLGVGGYLSGKLANITAMPLHLPPFAELQTHYAHAFFSLSSLLISATILCMLLNLLIKHCILMQPSKRAKKVPPRTNAVAYSHPSEKR